MLLYDIVDSFQKAKLPFAVVGGYALALHGIIRATMDVDLVIQINKTNLKTAESCLKDLGLESRLPITAEDVFNFKREYIEKRNLLAWSFVDPNQPTKQVDILIDQSLKDISTQKISVGGRKIPVADLNSLLEMKERAGRPQDHVDALRIREKLLEKKNSKPAKKR